MPVRKPKKPRAKPVHVPVTPESLRIIRKLVREKACTTAGAAIHEGLLLLQGQWEKRKHLVDALAKGESRPAPATVVIEAMILKLRGTGL